MRLPLTSAEQKQKIFLLMVDGGNKRVDGFLGDKPRPFPPCLRVDTPLTPILNCRTCSGRRCPWQRDLSSVGVVSLRPQGKTS